MGEFLYQAPARHPALGIAFLSLIALEFAWSKFSGRDVYDLTETGTTILVAIGQGAARGLTAIVLVPVYLLAYRNRLLHFELAGAGAWITLFILSEFSYYWFHRMSHLMRWMWATHSVHHSSTRLNFIAATRLGWTNLFSGGWLFLAPLVWLGFEPAAVLGMFAANLAFQFLLHTEAVGRLGPLEWILNTPAHHRVHHAVNRACLDRNFGGVLIVFDRMFGTFAEAPEGEALIYGLGGTAPDHNPFNVALGGWTSLLRDILRSRSPGEAWRTAFGRP